MKRKKSGRKHWRVVVQLVEIRNEEEQPVLDETSFPGVYTEHKGRSLYAVVCAIVRNLREMRAY